MKNLSLTVKIWLSLFLVSLVLYVTVILILPYLIHSFFTQTLIEPPPPKKHDIADLPPFITFRDLKIRSFILLEDGSTIPEQASQAFPSALMREIMENGIGQQSPRQEYEHVSGQEDYRYFIQKDNAYGRPLYQVVFVRKSEEENFIKTLLYNIMLFAGIALLFSWFASVFIARYLTQPLVKMKRHVKQLADRNWHQPIDVRQGDEIGQLANSIETMRQQLVQQDEAQQSMLQNISHELKTPIMVIRSYAQAIQDGVYPKGDLVGSIRVIDEEGERLEKLVRQLLYLTRLDYLASRDDPGEKIELGGLVEGIVQRLNVQRPEIACRLDLQPVTLEGDEETLRVMVENLLENHLHHAGSCIEISLTADNVKGEAVLSFWNDGSSIDPNMLNLLFRPFHKGPGGKFGLGLTIVQRILKIYHGEITVQNERGGVSSTVKIPLPASS